MQALWLTGNPLRCFRVADEQMIVDTQGVLLGGTNAGEQPTATPVELAAACAQVDLLVLVAGAAPLDGSWLGALPAHIPKLVSSRITAV